jgi:hypothetical protein
MISPPTIDGGTAFKLHSDATRWCPELRDLVEAAHAGRGVGETVSLHNDDGEPFEAIVIRRKHDGGVSLKFEHDAQLELYDRGGFAVLITKADALWREGLEAWMRRWFDLASWLLLGVRCSSPAHAFDLGWRTRNVELCADFTGLQIGHHEVQRFVGGSRKNGPGTISSHGYRRDGAVETVESAKRGKNALTVSTHNKTQKLRDDKDRPEGRAPTQRMLNVSARRRRQREPFETLTQVRL